jgi:hypothetical protein
MPPSIIYGCRRGPSAQAQDEISEPNPYRARGTGSSNPPPSAVSQARRASVSLLVVFCRIVIAVTGQEFRSARGRKGDGRASWNSSLNIFGFSREHSRAVILNRIGWLRYQIPMLEVVEAERPG